MSQPTFLYVINPLPLESSLFSRFQRTLKPRSGRNTYLLPHPESPAFPNGSSNYSIIHALGHEGNALTPLTNLSSGSRRHLSRAIAHARHGQVPLHLFGVIDNMSPFGSRRVLEDIIRILKQSRQKTILHVGVWHPTPREYTRGLAELKAVCDDSVSFGSVFSVDDVIHPEKASKYIDGITSGPSDNLSGSHDHLPLTQPHYYTNSDTRPQVMLFANHHFHGMDTFHELLLERGGTVYTLPCDVSPNSEIDSLLHRYKFVQGISNRKDYLHCYFSHDTDHQYFESIHTPSSLEGLEMLLSPHFGYSVSPAKTIIIFDEERHPEFDRLLDGVIKSKQQLPYHCIVLDTHNPRGNILITNQQMDLNNSFYPQINSALERHVFTI